MREIIFICNGNIERSVVAEKVLRDVLRKNNLDKIYDVSSYSLQGTMDTKKPLHLNLIYYKDEWNASKEILEKLGIDISDHISTPITKEIMEKASILIAMDQKTYQDQENSLLNQFSEYKNKIYNFSQFNNSLDLEDLAGSGDVTKHSILIETIYNVLNTKWKDILTLINQK